MNRIGKLCEYKNGLNKKQKITSESTILEKCIAVKLIYYFMKGYASKMESVRFVR